MPSGPDADFADRQRANKAFRDRYALSAAAQARNQPCADAVRAALEDLRRRNRYDDKAIVEVLTAVGLTGAVARPAGRLDVAGNGGLLFAGWTGQACVFGEHGPAATTVDVGGIIKDGGCLPAPD
jgi:hypothetical protein